MARYQIRTPENVVLEDVVEEMANKAWDVLRAWDVFEPGSQPSVDEFRRSIGEAIAPFIKSYKLCGRSNICLEGMETTAWSSQSHALDACPWDLVYHLFPRKDLDDFLVALATKASRSIEPSLKPETGPGVISSLLAVFQCVLGQYLYVNPVCGKTELCVYSTSAPVASWKRS